MNKDERGLKEDKYSEISPLILRKFQNLFVTLHLYKSLYLRDWDDC